ncbi:uncharacterized protein B0I36DRAFT_365955 [Microdochium trichocladiopsis]|uniref:DUF1765-domain-containing protein n=1 Tax=Microdochium trichocladiopsis TaxID=1682393 RepID=A0A9P9BQZ1_9PEZI|nr:uncharacterized protein B0I36DRAFT_365955 [Microdochium trichocladiopsis]KAH7026382.1 hypothetical protein B0I36DRAFT_365955 [Microdochium trichocladiopsis]
MSGPVLALTASPAVPDPARSSGNHPQSSSLLPHSSAFAPDLFAGLAHPLPSFTAPAKAPRDRSFSVKSLPSLPLFGDGVSLDFHADIDTSFSLSYADIAQSSDDIHARSRPSISASGLAPSLHTMGSMSKRRSILARPVSWMPVSRSSPEWDESDLPGAPSEADHSSSNATKSTASSRLDPRDLQDKPRAVSGSLTAAFARRSWLGSSARSPSPNKQDDGALQPDLSAPPHVALGSVQESPKALTRSATETSLQKLKKSARRGSGGLGSGNEGSKSTESMGKLGGYFSRKKQQIIPSKVPLTLNQESAGSSTTSLAPPSIEARPSHASETSNSTAPDDFTIASTPAALRDPLWSLFKSLDTDFAKFQAKPVSAKATVVRGTLLPFLRKFRLHPSNKQLRPTELEKRAVILNKWWTGILDMLQGSDQHTVPGVDKPCLYEAATLLMIRPEWRFSTSSFCALTDRSPKERLRKRVRSPPSGSSSESLESSEASFVADSADHNVRTMFTTKLVAQLVLIIDKLSHRHAPLSLVNFAGKACAYAFFFCPDVAAVLVRLWGLTPDMIRRVVDEFGLPRRSKNESDDIVALFPPNLEDLGWSSVKSSVDSLKRPAPLPLGTTKTQWHGPWVSRWKGRDSDLFFVFCKYFFILAEEFIPPGLPLVEKARAPAFVLVNSQILSVLDSTIHRQAAVGVLPGPGLMDADQGADTSLLSILPSPNNNAFKGMSENRLIVLLRDFLHIPTQSISEARHTFAEAFMSIMKSTAKRTSQFNHNACFTICDFLEEALPIYAEFARFDDTGVIYCDWNFWLDVLRKILESNNTMSEIRVLSLLFSIWDTVVSDPSRKDTVCHDWLISEEVFSTFFNNWCPMVRAYYMRLLCWRICRDTGAANEANARIFLAVWARLKMVWSHYLWLRQSAENEGKFPPSTAPSYPTPGKRFMIIRHEVPAPQNGLLVGFDQFSPQSSHADVPSGPATSFDAIHIPEAEAPPQYKKKWGLFGKVMSLSGSNPAPEDLESLRRETANARMRPLPPPKAPISSEPYQITASDADSMGSSPTYEAVQYIFKFTLSWNAPGTPHPLPRLLGRPRLPGPAQAVVNSRDRSGAQGQLPAASRPAAHRAVSGSVSAGLIEAARNALPIDEEATPRRPSDTMEPPVNADSTVAVDMARNEARNTITQNSYMMVEPKTEPMQPSGHFALGVKYAGRALAEWGLVVGEYNGFVDRRRDEGVMGLSEIEVPTLGVEGFRKH